GRRRVHRGRDGRAVDRLAAVSAGHRRRRRRPALSWCLRSGGAGHSNGMLVRRVARPLLSAVFIGQGIEALRRPEEAAETARPTVEGLQKLPDSAAAKIPQDPVTVARVTAAVQIGGGLLLASGRLPRLASAALACSVVPG